MGQGGNQGGWRHRETSLLYCFLILCPLNAFQNHTIHRTERPPFFLRFLGVFRTAPDLSVLSTFYVNFDYFGVNFGSFLLHIG